MAKEHFILHYDFINFISILDNEQSGILLKNLFYYCLKLPLIDMDKTTQVAFNCIINKIDADALKYEQKCKKNRENALKGGAPKGNKNASKEKTKTTQNNRTVEDNESNNKITKTTERIKKQPNTNTNTKLLKKEIHTNKLVCKRNIPTLDDVIEFFKTKNFNSDPKSFYDYYSVNNWLTDNGQPIKVWKRKAISWENMEIKNANIVKINSFNKFEQNDYDFDELEKELERRQNN